MNCRQIDKLIYDYCDGNVTPETAKLIEQHLQDCPFCRNNEKLTRMENEVLTGPDFSPVLSAGFTHKVMTSINTNKYNKLPYFKKTRFRNLWFKYRKLYNKSALAVALIVLLVVAAGSVYNHHNLNNLTKVADKGVQVTKQARVSPDSNSQKGMTTGSKETSPENKVTNDKIAGPKDLASLPAGKRDDTLNMSYDGTSPSTVSPLPTEDIKLKSTRSLGITSAQQSRGGRHETTRLEPVNIPAEYELINICTDDSNVTYVYSGFNQTKDFKISVYPEKMEMFQQDSIAIKNNVTDQSITSIPVSWNITYKNKDYNITLTGNITPGELQDLAQSIKFEEKTVDN